MQPLLRDSFSTNGLDSTNAARSGEPSDGLVAGPGPDHRKLLGVLIAVKDANALTVDEAEILDLTTLVTAYALVGGPKTMPAVIWPQPEAEPWRFTVEGGHRP